MKAPQWVRATAVTLIVAALLTLTGCLYPEDQTPGNDGSVRQAVLAVQDSVDRYREQSGLLPIQNADASVPLYEKYKIDFGKLKRMGFIGQVPSAAFENGGEFQFLVIDEETNPQVKLLDLATYQTITDVQKKVDAYRAAHADKLPAGAELYAGYPSIDFGKLGMKEPDIVSVYSRQTLNAMLDGNGQVRVDYGIDIVTAIKKSGAEPKPDEDLRRVLIEQSYYVPVKSPEYVWTNGEPVPVAVH
ncbi:hypothetical protein ACFPPD_03570 [Cohnella suwonensis]|uniref:Uncharacterized protein n=1 Tax=Cohnella suwonensis TaxID=696072 RepID=A0ABW0LT60_9BACL